MRIEYEIITCFWDIDIIYILEETIMYIYAIQHWQDTSTKKRGSDKYHNYLQYYH